MKMDLQKSLANQVASVAKFEIGEIVFINLPEGEQGIVFAYIVYNTHIEYLVRTVEQGVMQLEEVCLTDQKRII